MPTGKAKFVSRAGEKLCAALDAFGLNVSGRSCADFGCNVGGFTDCLLQRGASRVYAVDTGYGELAWTLRKDHRVVVMERTNALYCPVPGKVDIVVIDVAWTSQAFAIPAAARWLKHSGIIVSLLKPHYELAKKVGKTPHAPLSDTQAGDICLEVCHGLSRQGLQVLAGMKSPLRGKGGNTEFLVLVAPS